MRALLPVASALALIFLLTTGSSLPASAAVLYSTGFEPPTFTTGSVDGQDGWYVYGNSAAAQVENSFAYAGTQALEVIPTLTSGQTGAYKALSTSASIIEQTAEVYLASSSDQSAWQFSALGPNLTRFVGGIDVLADNQIDLQTLGFRSVGAFTRNQWNSVSLILNFSTQTYAVDINGVTLASNVAFCGDNSTCAGGYVAQYGDGFFATYHSVGRNDVGYIDNYIVSSVPLPASAPMFGAALVALGAVGFHLRRRREAAPAA